MLQLRTLLQCATVRLQIALQNAAMGLQVAMENVTSNWTILALDMHELMGQTSKAPFKCTKSVQFCANMKARGAFTSDVKCATTQIMLQCSNEQHTQFFLTIR